MTIKVVGKGKAQKYEVTCTDVTCRNVIQFDHDDVKYVNNSVMGRTTATIEGISCPECRQILPLKTAIKIAG